MKNFTDNLVCEKCLRHNIDVKWHVGAVVVTMGELPTPRCDLSDFIQEPEEHLHCYCQCGFEWLMTPGDVKRI